MSKDPGDPIGFRISLNFFAIPLGISGLGGAWTTASAALGAPGWINGLLFWISGVCWLVLSVLYVGERLRSRGAFRADREHPTDGAQAAFIPVVGLLLLAHFEQYMARSAAQAVCWVLVFSLAVVAGQLFAHWLTGQTSFPQLHPGYFLPLVAGPFVAGITLSVVGAQTAGRAALGAGMFFWVIIGGVVTARLITAGPLPTPAIPALSVLLAPPATGGIAIFVAYHGRTGTLQTAFLGIFMTMLMVQIFLLPQYRRIGFGLQFWTFTFPVAASANYGMRWCQSVRFPGWQELSWLALAIATAVVLAIAVATVRSLVPVKRDRTPRPATELEPEQKTD
ncbi:TDT family transporter [Streptomyces bauhiniae]|uniref:SLAC1 family transporter n=1 Tax=Streptomyces bauhiniae TaxID=2340725 RepID=UPI00364D94D3